MVGQVGQLPHQYFGVAVNGDVVMTSSLLHSAPPIISLRLPPWSHVPYGVHLTVSGQNIVSSSIVTGAEYVICAADAEFDSCPCLQTHENINFTEQIV